MPYWTGPRCLINLKQILRMKMKQKSKPQEVMMEMQSRCWLRNGEPIPCNCINCAKCALWDCKCCSCHAGRRLSISVICQSRLWILWCLLHCCSSLCLTSPWFQLPRSLKRGDVQSLETWAWNKMKQILQRWGILRKGKILSGMYLMMLDVKWTSQNSSFRTSDWLVFRQLLV